MLRILSRLLLTAIVLAYLTAVPGAVPASAGPGDAASADPCCDPVPPPPGAESAAGGDDCCPDDCQRCPRPCCGGQIPAVAADPANLVARATVENVDAPAPACPPGGDPRDIEHPPRI